jgi:DNA-binding MarR family transcriptional regulator
MTAEQIHKLEDCYCMVTRKAARQITQFYSQFMAGTGLRATQFSVLSRLSRRGPTSINALADYFVMDRTTLGRNVRPLERDGLIAIKPSATDRRVKELHITKAGQKRFETALEGWAKAQAQFEASFGSARAVEMRTVLRAMLANDFESATKAATAKATV